MIYQLGETPVSKRGIRLRVGASRMFVRTQIRSDVRTTRRIVRVARGVPEDKVRR